MGADTKPGKIIWYPSYIGDVLSVTALMSPHEVCAYFLITTHLWNAGGSLPADDAKLARIANLSLEEWQVAKPTLMQIFKVKSETLTQPEITEGIKRAKGKIEQASRAGQASAASRRKKNANETATVVERTLDGRSNETATGVATGSPTERATKQPTKIQPRASEGEGTYPEREVTYRESTDTRGPFRFAEGNR